MLPADDKRAANIQPPHWFHAPYVAEWIRDAKAAHEIGTHTFSHIYTADPATTAEVWAAEMEQCAALHRELGLALHSLVYPRNQIKFLDTLEQYGIVAYRGVEGNRAHEQRGVAHLMQRALALPPPTYNPQTLEVGERLVNLPASQFLLAYDGIRGRIPTASRVRQARLGIEQAVQRGEIYHLWFHPFNLGTSARMFEALEQILIEAAQRRERGQLQVLTMAQAAEWALGNIH
jgi:hypothetical protein